MNKIDNVADLMELTCLGRRKNKCKCPEAEMVELFLRHKKEVPVDEGA